MKGPQAAGMGLVMLLAASCGGGGGDSCASISDSCTEEGVIQCRGDNKAVIECQRNQDGCLVWTPIAECAEGQTCTGAGAAAQCSDACTSDCRYEPPIDITFNVHFDPVLDKYDVWRDRKDNLLWLQSFVEGYSGMNQPKLNLQMQGDHAEFYLDSSDDEAAEGRAALAALYKAGHTFGTHAHNTIRGDAPHSWHMVNGTPTAAQSVEHWQDHLNYVEQLYAAITGNDDPEFLREMNASAVMFLPHGLEAQQQAYAGTYTDPATHETVPHGFTIQTGGPDEYFFCLFGHEVENPWRPGLEGPLDEDLSNTVFVRVPGLTSLGKVGVHGQIPNCYQDTSLPSYQRMFIQVFLERLYHEYTDAQDKVWTFGWHEHMFDLYPSGTSSGPGKYAFREYVKQMVDWLNERFIGRTTANGNLVARYATMTQVRDEFLAWEADNPGVSSFEVAKDDADWEYYPYKLKGLAQALANAHYDEALLPPDSTLQVYRFERCPSALRGETQGYWAYESDGSLGCYDSSSNKGKPTGNVLPITTVYVAWRDAAEPEPTDLTPYVGNHATAYDGVSGEYLRADEVLSALPLNYKPVILLAQSGTTQAGYLMVSYNANYMWGQPVEVHEATADQFVSTLTRHLDLMDSLGITADYYFTGLAAEHLAEWSQNTVSRLLKSDHGIYYHGANRAPYPQLVDQVKGQDWEEDVATATTYEAEGVNPATNQHVGGINAFRKVFGQDPFATGRFFQASILYVDKQLGVRMGVGLKDNTGAPQADAWFLGVLNRPTQAGLSSLGLAQAAVEDRADEYLSYARSVLTGVSGPMPLVALPIHDHDFFDHSPTDQEKVWALYQQVLVLAQELGFKFVTMRDVYAWVKNGPAPALKQGDLLAAAQSLADTVEQTGYPPTYVEAGGVPYSLAEIFEGLARALRTYSESGKLPAAVETHDLLGPTTGFKSSVTTGTVSSEAVLEASVGVATALIDRIPSEVTVGSQTVNPAEYLYLMAQVYGALSEAKQASVTLRPVSLLPLSVIENKHADPLTKLQFWTYKPTLFAVPLSPHVSAEASRFGLDYVLPLDPMYHNEDVIEMWPDMFAKAGLRWVNFATVTWNATEPEPPGENGQHHYDWSTLDEAVKAWQKYGFLIVMTLQLKNGWFSGPIKYSPGGLDIKGSDRLPAEDYQDDYRAWIAALVERYDGDDDNDMEGLLFPILHYQIGNEYSNPIYWTGEEPGDYEKLLQMAREAAHNASPDVQIISNGIRWNDAFHNDPTAEHFEETFATFMENLPSDTWREVWERARLITEETVALANVYDILDAGGNGPHETSSEGYMAWVQNELAKNGLVTTIWDMEARSEPRLTYNKLIQFHEELTIPNGDEILCALKNQKNCAYDHDTAEAWYRAEQSRVLVKVFVTRFAAGFEKVFMGMPNDWDKSPAAAGFPNTFVGLTDDDGDPRWPAFYALKLLVDKLDGFEKAEKMPVEDDKVALYRFTFADGRLPVWVVWLWEDAVRGLEDPLPTREVQLDIPGPVTMYTIPTESNAYQTSLLLGDKITLTVSPQPVLLQEKVPHPSHAGD